MDSKETKRLERLEKQVEELSIRLTNLEAIVETQIKGEVSSSDSDIKVGGTDAD